MKLFDLHCDTPTALYKRKERLSDNSLHVSLSRAKIFERYIQCAAFWCPKELSDRECLEYFSGVSSFFEKEAGGFITDVKSLKNKKKSSFILTVEDSRLISHAPENITLLFSKGVRIMTLVWGKKSSVGAAWNASGGLTKTGKDILELCFDTGIIPDLSHANDKVTDYALKRSAARGYPLIATHSNARAVCPHKRNLQDRHATGIAELGGIIGISLYPPHLFGERADISHIISHIRHYISIAGIEAVCLGCDLDGIDSTPDGINTLSDLPIIFDAISRELGSLAAQRIFFDNAYNFFINNLPQ